MYACVLCHFMCSSLSLCVTMTSNHNHVCLCPSPLPVLLLVFAKKNHANPFPTQQLLRGQAGSRMQFPYLLWGPFLLSLTIIATLLLAPLSSAMIVTKHYKKSPTNQTKENGSQEGACQNIFYDQRGRYIVYANQCVGKKLQISKFQ